jgi:hypothetical protein
VDVRTPAIIDKRTLKSARADQASGKRDGERRAQRRRTAGLESGKKEKAANACGFISEQFVSEQ